MAGASTRPANQDVLVGVVRPTTKPDPRARDLVFMTGKAIAEAGAVGATRRRSRRPRKYGHCESCCRSRRP